MNSPLVVASSQSFWLTLARVLQAFIICLTIGLFIMSIPISYEQRNLVCTSEPCRPNQLTSASVQALYRIGMSVSSFVNATLALDILVAATFTACAVVIFVRKPNDILTIFVTIMLATFGAATTTGAILGIGIAYPQLDWLVQTIALIGDCSILAFFFVFPNGRFVPSWTVPIIAAYTLIQLPRYYFPASSLNWQFTNPPVLDEFGLVTAIREHLAPYTRPNGMRVTFDITEPMPALPAAVEVAVYRIALEAFTNIVNHAQASACQITIKIEDNSLLLIITDNGKGLSPNNHSGVGLTSMRERAAALGGEFMIENNRSSGTSVRARLPLQ